MQSFNYKNRNQRLVTVRQERSCSCCGKLIPSGNIALSTNARQVGRRWYCMDCIEHELERIRLENHLSHVAFGDDGSAQFYIDEIAKHPRIFD